MNLICNIKNWLFKKLPDEASIKDKNIDFKFIDVKKSYGSKEVLKGLNLSIHKGERIAIIGANGSGKSTMIKIITGLTKTFEGKVDYVGFRGQMDFLYNVGVQFQENNWPVSFKVEALIDLVSSINYDRNNKTSKKKWMIESAEPWKNELLKSFNLWDHKEKKVKSLSGGQKQLLNILLAFVSKPRFLILDEITTGLDVRMQERILNFIDNYVTKNHATLLVVSHIANEIDHLVDKLVILEDGKFTKTHLRKTLEKKFGTTQKYLSHYFGE